MKMILLSKKDVEALNGKWILQVDTNNPDYTITAGNGECVIEKGL